MTTPRSDSPLNWGVLYRRLSAPLCDFDCGQLCAPANKGIPACCDNADCPPVLFTEELRWLRARTEQWRKRRAVSPHQKKDDREIEDYIVYAMCRGVESCKRRFRSLTCRFFPFEPYIDEKDRFQGLTWIYRCEHLCPLIGSRRYRINQQYVNQSIDLWKTLFALFPGERDCYCDESRKLRHRFAGEKRKIRVFRIRE